MQLTTSPITGLVRIQQYQSERSNVFPSVESLRWYLREHRKGLEGASALLYIAGRLWADPNKFDAYVLDAGRRQREAA